MLTFAHCPKTCYLFCVQISNTDTRTSFLCLRKGVGLLPEDPLADVLEEPEDGVALEGIVACGEVVERHPAGPHVQLLTGEFFRPARHLSSQQEKLTSVQVLPIWISLVADPPCR
jgi:hypothetical protein